MLGVGLWLSLWAWCGSALAVTLITEPGVHDALVLSTPAAGTPATLDLDALPAGTQLADQFVDDGVVFDASEAVFVLPEAFGTPGQSSNVAVAGFDAAGSSVISFYFTEPQRHFSFWVVDAENPIFVEVWLEGLWVDTVELDVLGEGLVGGRFAALGGTVVVFAVIAAIHTWLGYPPFPM